MRARRVNGRDLSHGTVTGGKAEKLPVYTINKVLREFIDENLLGAMEYSGIEGTPSEYIVISTDHTAHFLRLLLQSTRDTAVVRVSLRVEDENVILTANLGDEIPSDEDIRLICAAAEKAGFSLTVQGCELCFSTPTVTTTVFSLYSIPPSNVYLDFIYVFFDM